MTKVKSPGVYRIFNKITRKNFIGASLKDWRGRQAHQLCMLRKGAHPCKALQEDWSKYGEQAFEFHLFSECKEEDLKEKLSQAQAAFLWFGGYNEEKYPNRFSAGRLKNE